MKPVLGPSHDGIYPRCVYCRGENYALAVLAYSAGEHPCAAVNGCGRYLPAAYWRCPCPDCSAPREPGEPFCATCDEECLT